MTGAQFSPITGADWAESLPAARKRRAGAPARIAAQVAAARVPKLCEDCAHRCFASTTNRTTCGRRLGQRYLFPEKNGDAHGYAPTSARCFVAKEGGGR